MSRIGECWSMDNETFNHATLGDLLDENDELVVGSTVYVGIASHPEPGDLVDADDVITMIGERAYDIAGEYADDYPDVTKEAVAELTEFIAAWIGKHCPPTFYQVSKTHEYVLTTDDFGEERGLHENA